MKTVSVEQFNPGVSEGYSEVLEEFLHILQQTAESKHWCLNLNSATGEVAFALAAEVRWILGIDQDARAVESARRKAQNQGITNVQFIVGNVSEMHFDELAPVGHFQLVAINNAFNEQQLNNLPDAMEPGSALIGSVFETNHLLELNNTAQGSGWSENRLMTLLKAHGFRIEHMDVIGHVVTFDTIEQVEQEYLNAVHVAAWKADGRWSALEKAFAAGNRSLTDSRIVFSARLT